MMKRFKVKETGVLFTSSSTYCLISRAQSVRLAIVKMNIRYTVAKTRMCTRG